MASDNAERGRVLRGIGLVMVSLIGLPAVGHAANNCAWLNEATASGFLGGSATGTFTEAGSGQPAACSFVNQDAGGTRTLRITVELDPDAHARMGTVAASCGADAAPLKAIGNEALVCAADDHKVSQGERVVGRVSRSGFHNHHQHNAQERSHPYA
jgi:hypothetical protein